MFQYKNEISEKVGKLHKMEGRAINEICKLPVEMRLDRSLTLPNKKSNSSSMS